MRQELTGRFVCAFGLRRGEMLRAYEAEGHLKAALLYS